MPPPKKTRRVDVEDEQALHQGIPIEMGRKNRIVIGAAPVHLHVQLLDAFGLKPLDGVACTARGADGSTYEGTTDARGRFRRSQVKPVAHRIELVDPHGRSCSVAVPFLVDADEPHLQTVPGYGASQLFLELYDGDPDRPLASTAVSVHGPAGQRWELRTDARGRLCKRPVPPGSYLVEVQETLVRVPSIDPDSDEPHLQVIPASH